MTRLYFPVTVDGGPGGYDALEPAGDLTAFCFDSDAEREAYLSQKREIAAQPGRGPQRLTGATADAAIAAAEVFVRRHAASSLPLDDLMLQLQEDLVVMHLPAGHAPERSRALYMHVCFPGGWDPSQLLGKSFTALHARVPYEPGFERSERAEHAGLLFQAPLARYVWSVTPEPTLDRHPKTPRSVAWSDASALFLRVERQIMVPLPATAEGTTSLFFIRTYVYGRERLSVRQREILADTISAMSSQMLRYKGMIGQESRILQLLT
jgi:hypothetical protein